MERKRLDPLPQRRVKFSRHRLLIGTLGFVLCAGLWACGGGDVPPETASAETPAATQPAPPAPSDPSVPNQDAAVGSEVPPDPSMANLPPVQATERGTAQKAHFAITGDYNFEGTARSNCALFPNKTFQIGLNLPRAPYFVLRLENFHGAGEYDAEGRVRAVYSGETFRTSKGLAKTSITITPATAPGGRDLISGSFSGPFKGEGGEGTVSGSFENCAYDLPTKNG